MSLLADLLEQAQHLARREPRKPRQASLPRAASTACYAMFHPINQAAAFTLALNASVDIQHRIERWFQHGEMKPRCDLSWSMTRSDAQQYREVAGKTNEAWKRIASTSEASVFLLSLVLWKNWERS